MRSRGLLLLFLGLTLAVAANKGVGVLAEEALPAAKYGVGAHWFIFGMKDHFFGVTGKVEIPSSRTVVDLLTIAALFELGLAQEPGGDDDVVLLNGSLVAYFPSGLGRAYLGVGMGIARWRDRTGLDSGIWINNYRQVIAGREFSWKGRLFFFQLNLTFDLWFKSVITLGVWL